MKRENKKLKVTIIIILALIVMVGAIVGILFLTKNSSMRYFEVKLTDSSGKITLSTKGKSLAPGVDVISRPITVNIAEGSANSLIRAKIVFESNSDDDRVLSFVNQLNYYMYETQTYEDENYSWKYFAQDNAFYLVTTDTSLRIVTSLDDNYIFINKFIIPHQIEQIASLNSDLNNVQVGEDIIFKVVFEAVQSQLMIDGLPKIENCREYFNNLSTFTENGYTSVNGFITNCSLNNESLILPKYVGDDYIIGVKDNAFEGSNIKQIIVPGSYVFFGNNSFANLTNLNFIALKSYTKINLTNSTFSANANLKICVPKQNISYLKTTYALAPFVSNIKNYTEVSTSNIAEISATTELLYAPNVTEFVGDFKKFTNLKVIIAPSLKVVNEGMFSGLEGLIEADLNNVTEVKNNAFYGCKNLIKASFSKNLNSIGESSFLGCVKLLDINFVQNLTTIPMQAFRNCSSINKLTLNAENVQILDSAFNGCTNLKIVEIKKPANIKVYSFANCSNLRYININSFDEILLDQTSFEGSNHVMFVFKEETLKQTFATAYPNFANNIILFKIKDGVLTKFEGNIKNLDLTEFNLSEKIVEIGKEAFKNNTTIQSLIIPSSVRKIGANFVDNATSLTTITINSYAPPVFDDLSFENIRSDLAIFVPAVNLELYKATLSSDLIILEK